MFHAITLRLPAGYQRKGAAFPGIAFFQGEGEFAEPYKARGFRDPFAKQFQDARPHPQLQLREDLIGRPFALIWSTGGRRERARNSFAVMLAGGQYDQCAAFDPVDQAVLVGDAARPCAFQVPSQLLRFANALGRVALGVCDQAIHPPQD
jgi:hypothetical protein